MSCVCVVSRGGVKENGAASPADSLNSLQDRMSESTIVQMVTVEFMDPTTGRLEYPRVLDFSKYDGVTKVVWVDIISDGRQYGYMPVLETSLKEQEYQRISDVITTALQQKTFHMYYASERKSSVTLNGRDGFWHHINQDKGVVPGSVKRVVFSIGMLKAGGLAQVLSTSPYYEAPSLPR